MCAVTDVDGRVVTMSDELLGRMTRDVTRLVLGSRTVLLAATLLVVLLAGLVALVADGDATVVLPLLVTVPAAVAVVVLGTRRSVRRALRTALPPGTSVHARAAEDGLHQSNAFGASHSSWAAFCALEVRGSAAVLRLRGTSAFAVLPSELFSEEDLERIRDGIR